MGCVVARIEMVQGGIPLKSYFGNGTILIFNSVPANIEMLRASNCWRSSNVNRLDHVVTVMYYEVAG